MRREEGRDLSSVEAEFRRLNEPEPAANPRERLIATAWGDTLSVLVSQDGVVVASGTSPDVTPADFASMSDLWLGKSRFPDPYLDGAIDELRIGCRALTADEIVTLSRP